MAETIQLWNGDADGSTVEDTWLNGGSRNTNYSTATTMSVGMRAGNARRLFIGFYPSEVLPAYDDVEWTQADLVLLTLGFPPPASAGCTLHWMNRTAALTAQMTWNDYKTGFFPWTTGGGDWDATPTTTGTIPASPAAAFRIDIDAFLQESLDPGTRMPMLVKLTTESGTNNWTIAASEYGSGATDPPQRPYLELIGEKRLDLGTQFGWLNPISGNQG